MKRNDSGLLIGGMLVLGGVLFLLMNLGFFSFMGGLIMAGLFGLAGLAFLYVVIRDRAQWWAAIPAFVLMGLGATIMVEDVLGLENLGGFVFLGSMGVGFLAVYLLRPENWWAIIPGGVLGTLAVTALMDEWFGAENPILFFLGLAATFGLVYLAPASQKRIEWALYPALGLLAVALIVGTSLAGLINYLWPLALIGGGLYLILRRQQADTEKRETAKSQQGAEQIAEEREIVSNERE